MASFFENMIIERIVDSVNSNGFTINVSGMNEVLLKKSNSKVEIMKAINSCQEDCIFGVYEGNKLIGLVKLVFNNGNHGADVISNYTSNPKMEMVMENAMLTASLLS